MGLPPHILSFFAVLCILSSVASAFNITEILNEQSGFGNFNSLLSRTGVAGEINNGNTITVLALDDGAMGSVSSRPDKVIANILRVHVLLDYYDKKILADMSGKETKSSDTLYQRTGTATGQNGRINVTKNGGNVLFKSAGDNAHQESARLVHFIVAENYKISVIQVSQAIIPDGIEKSGAPSPHQAPPPHSNDDDDKETPSPSPDSSAPTSDAPSPTSDDADSDDGPSSSPEDGTPSDDGSDKKKSAGNKVATAGLGGSIVTAMAAAAALVGF